MEEWGGRTADLGSFFSIGGRLCGMYYRGSSIGLQREILLVLFFPWRLEVAAAPRKHSDALQSQRSLACYPTRLFLAAEMACFLSHRGITVLLIPRLLDLLVGVLDLPGQGFVTQYRRYCLGSLLATSSPLDRLTTDICIGLEAFGSPS